MSKTEPKSWRDVIKVHPAADLFPMMMPDELKALGEDIKRNGMTAPIVWWTEREADIEKTPPPKYQLLDGRNRLDAMEMVGLTLIDASSKPPVFYDWVWEDCRFGEGGPQKNAMTGETSIEKTDPFEYVLSANLHRRHLTAEQKREIVAKVLKAQPEKSNRTIAQQTNVDHKTVGLVRDKLEGRGEIPHVSTVEDTKGRQQPTKKARRSADDFITDRKAQAVVVADRAEERSQQAEHVDGRVQNAAQAVEQVEPKQSDIERELPDADRLIPKIIARDAIEPGYALAVDCGIATYLREMPGFLKRTAKPTAPGKRT